MLLNRLYELLGGLRAFRKSNRSVVNRHRASISKLERLEERLVLATDVWTGAISDLWSVDGNWQDGTAPEAGDDLVFPAGASNLATTHDTALSVESFNSITIESNGYTISSSASGPIAVSAGIFATYDTSESDFNIDVELGSAIVTVDAGATLNIGGVITGSSGLTLSGGGTLVLTETSSYTGTTLIQAGVLQVDGTIASDVALDGGTLTGTGTLAGAGFSGTTGVVDPGEVDVPGILNYSSTTGLTLGPDTTFRIDIDGLSVGTGYDQLKLTNSSGLFNPNGATLEVDVGYLPAINTSFQIVSQTFSSPITGRFLGLSQFGSFTVDNVTFSIGYFNSGIVLTVTDVVIPTFTWSGNAPADSLWSTPENWVGDVVPTPGSNLVFPGGASRLSNYNDIVDGTYNSIEIAASGYNIGGLGLSITNGMSTTYNSGSSTFELETTLPSSQTFNIAEGGTLEMSGAIKVTDFMGGYGVTKTGEGTLRFSGNDANTYNGHTTINAGTLVLAKPNNVISANGSVTVGDNVSSAALITEGDNQFWVGSDVTVNEGSVFTVGASTQNISNLNLQGSTVQIDAGGVLETFVGLNSFATVNDVTSSIQGQGALKIDNLMNTFTIADDLSVDVDLRISTSITGDQPTSSFTKQGAGTLALSGDNTFGGDVSLIDGAIQVESNMALGDAVGTTTAIDGTSIYFVGIGLILDETLSISGVGIALSGVLQVLSGSTFLTGTVNMAADSQIGTEDLTSLSIGGMLTGTAGLTKTGAGSLALSVSNSFTGDTTVEDGHLLVSSDDALGLASSSATIAVNDGATIELTGGISIPATKSFELEGSSALGYHKVVSSSGSNAIFGTVGLLSGPDVAFDTDSGTTLTLNGVISGLVPVSKVGSGTLVAAAANTHIGAVTVDEGTLTVTGSLSGSSLITVNGTLDGTGTVSAVQISTTGTLSPGAPVGSLTMDSVIFADSNSIFQIQLNGPTAGSDYDTVFVDGTVDLVGATLIVALGYVPSGGDSFTIINNLGPTSVNGTFNGLAEGASLTVGGQAFTITYEGGDGNDVVLNSNNAPTAIQLANNTVLESASIGETVGGFSTTDADLGDTFTYTLVSGVGDTDNNSFDIDPSGNLITAVALDYETQSVYSIRVRSTDAGGLFTEQDFEITVGPINDNVPTFTSSDTFSVAENTITVGTVVATDADLPSQIVTYSITGGLDSSSFSIDPLTGELTFDSAPNFELPNDSNLDNIYELEVTANDGSGLTTIQNITVTVTPVNDVAPVFTSLAAFSVVENTTAVGTVVATDADLPAQTITYTISGGTDAGAFSINSSTGELTFTSAPNFESPGDTNQDNIYDIEVTANDNSGLTTIQFITVSVTPDNDNAPGFTSLPTFNVIENSTTVGTVIALDADVPGQTVTYSITGGADAAAFSIDLLTGVLSFNTAPDYDLPGDTNLDNVYEVQVTANDNAGMTAIQNIEVTITPVNDNAPIFTSSPTFSVLENTTTVGIVAATDADLPDQTIAYSITGGVDAALFTINPVTGDLTFVSAPDFEMPADSNLDNVYDIEVTANDNSGSTIVQSIAITVLPGNDAAPVFTSNDAFSVPENTTAVGIVTATDADLPGQTVTFAITGGSDASAFAIDPITGVLTFNTAPNFELPTDSDADNVYDIEVTANDNSGLTSVQSIAITVTPVNDNAPIFTSQPGFIVAENTTAVGTVTATDADLPGQVISYLISGGADAAAFSIDPLTGALTFNVAPDYELPGDFNLDNVYDIEVTASDLSGSTTVQTIAVTVMGANDLAPVFTSPATFSVAENTTAVGNVVATDADLPGQVVSYSITGGADATLFSIDPVTGALSFNVAPDFELPSDDGSDNIYDVEVTASDNMGSTTAQSIVVTVTAVNDNAPIFSSPATFDVPENTQTVGTVAASDADLPGQTINYAITGGVDAAAFAIDPVTGLLTFNALPNFELPGDSDADNVYNIEVTASDNSGSTTTQQISVTVTPVNDNAPIFTSPMQLVTPENSTAVGTVAATDADLPGQTISYSITGGLDAALFSVNPVTGMLTFLTLPDYENPVDAGANNSYDLQITASDGFGSSTVQDLTVNVSNLVEAPVITLTTEEGSYLLDKKGAAVDPTATYRADSESPDYSAAQLTVSITSNRQRKDVLSINSEGDEPGQISTKGKNVLYGGVVIGTVQGGKRSQPNLVISFNSAATDAAVDALVKQITFFSKKDRRATATSRTVQMQVTNASGFDSNQATRVINIEGTY